MIVRVWIAYKLEVLKAIRLKFTYLGPALVVLTVAAMPLLQRFERDGVSDYAFIAYTTPVALNLVGLILLLAYCASLVSNELASGTIRTLLVRPLRRYEFLAAKLLLGMTYAVVLTASAAAATWAIAFALGDLAGVAYGGEVVFTASRMMLTYLAGAAAALAPQFAAVAFAVMLSSLTRNTGAAVGGAMSLWVVSDTLKYPLRAAPYLFSTYLETPWQVFQRQVDALEGQWLPDIGYCLLTSTVSFVIFAAIAMYALSRRNLNT